MQELNAARKLDAEIAAILTTEGFSTARGHAFSDAVVWKLRKRWHIPTVKEHATDHTTHRWRDGSYTAEGLATTVGVSLRTAYQWIWEGRIKAQQLLKGMPWKITVTTKEIKALQHSAQQAQRGKQPPKEVL